MVIASMVVYPVTWLGKPVCDSCRNELEKPEKELQAAGIIGGRGWASLVREQKLTTSPTLPCPRCKAAAGVPCPCTNEELAVARAYERGFRQGVASMTEKDRP